MAALRLTVASKVLGRATTLSALLPGQGAPSSATPVLYLLHGLGEDDGAWLRRSRIAEHVAGLGLAVVMPAIGESFGVDEAHGAPYGTYLAEEVPDLVAKHLGLAPDRAGTFVAGLSMGGYAALRWALGHPGRFAAAAGLSGSLDIADPDRYRRRPALMRRLFGGRDVPGTADDLFWLLAHVGAARPASGADPDDGARRGFPLPPALYVACGTQDPHLAEAQRFVAAARAAGVPVTAAFGPGRHDWAYWDGAIRDVLAWLPLPGSR